MGLAFWCALMVAARLYYAGDAADVYGTAVHTPHSSWEVTGTPPLNVQKLLRTKVSASSQPAAAATGTANQDRLSRAYAFPLIGSGTLSGTVKGQISAREAALAVDARAQMLIRIMSNDWTTERGVALAHDTGALSSEFFQSTGTGANLFENRKFPRGGSQSLTPVDWQAGDWLVVEVGWRNHGTNTSNAGLAYGGLSSDGDLPEDETTRVDNQVASPDSRPWAWVEFSQDLFKGLASATLDAYVATVAPTWVSPADGAAHSNMPVLVFTMPSLPGTLMHFQMQLDQVNTFDSGSLRTYSSFLDNTGWEYWNNSAWTQIPTTGVPVAYVGNQARLTVPSGLANGTWYRRVRGGRI